ncbi:Clavaminate synthase-like protein, partial [Armillaria novae-zelandiae]
MAIEVEHYVPPSATQEPYKLMIIPSERGLPSAVDYVDLPIIDLSKGPRPEDVREAMKTYGFFYIVGHGLSLSKNQQIFDIADIPFSAVSDEEKQQYEAKIIQTGSYQGYKLQQYWHIDNGVKDQIEHYNSLRLYLEEIEAFMRHNHYNVLHPILWLGLPENTLVDIHRYSSVGETFCKASACQLFYPYSAEDNKKTNNVWLKGHTDFGSITILYSQPVLALQILMPSGDWKWVKHVENALVINARDALEFLSGEVFRSTIHRVVQPPKDQEGHPHLGVFYFAMPNDNVKLLPLVNAKE